MSPVNLPSSAGRPESDAGPPSLVFAGHRLFDGLSVAGVAEVGAVIAAEGGIDPDAIARRFPRLRTRCLEDLDERREQWTSAHLDRVIETLSDDALPDGSHAQLLPYAGCPAADRLGNRSLSISAELRHHLDDKRCAKAIFASLGIPTIKGHAAPVDRDSLAEARDRLGYPYVARAPFASSGLGTFLVRSDDDAELVLGVPHADGPWLFEEYVTGYSLNTTGVVGTQRTAVFAPSVQILGEPECSDLPFGFCGNDYPTAGALPEPVLREVAAQTRTLGDHLRELGYRGVFGMDLVIDRRGRVLPCEINPRFQNSTALLNFGLAGTPALTPAAAHLASFAGVVGETSPQPVTGPPLSQILVHSSIREPDQVSGAGVHSGQYRRRGDEYAYLGDTFDPRDLDDGDMLVVGGVSRAGMQVKAGAGLARLIVKGPVLDAESFRLTPAAITAIRWLRGRIELRDAQPVAGLEQASPT